jgi:hypothetical protein
MVKLASLANSTLDTTRAARPAIMLCTAPLAGCTALTISSHHPYAVHVISLATYSFLDIYSFHGIGQTLDVADNVTP